MDESTFVSSEELIEAEQRYRELVRRWYPHDWAAANGDAVVGTMLDVAEQRGTTALSPAGRVDVVAHGVLAHLRGSLKAQVRDRVASIGVGTLLGYSTVAALTAVGPVPWGHPHRGMSLLPFLAAWFIVVGLAFVRDRGLRLAGLVLAVATTVTTCGGWWWDGPFGGAHDLPSLAFVVQYFGPAIAAPVVLLATASGATFVGRPRIRDAIVSALAVAAVFVGLLLVLTHGLVMYEPDWFWSRDWARSNLPAPFLGSVALGVVVALAFLAARRRGTALAVTVSLMPWCLAWLVELAIDPAIGIPA